MLGVTGPIGPVSFSVSVEACIHAALGSLMASLLHLLLRLLAVNRVYQVIPSPPPPPPPPKIMNKLLLDMKKLIILTSAKHMNLSLGALSMKGQPVHGKRSH